VPQRLKNLKVTRVALCAAGMNQEAEIALFKSAEESHISEEAVVADEITTEEVVEETVPKADYDAIVSELDELKALVPEAPAEEIDKAALPESVIKALAEGDELRERVAKMEQAARDADFVAKAAEFGHVAPAADLAPVLELLDRTDPELAKTLDQALKAANARIAESGLYEELGSDTPAGDSSQVDALINAEVAKGTPRHDAIRKVFTEHPELYPATTAAATAVA
jgi:ribosomal 50S subunit-associated protein YjgA (DUF615 family)